jgi:transcriptional regulator with XRE-family HTH domain
MGKTMIKIRMEAVGRFGNLFAEAANKKGVSLDAIAAKVDYSYEQMRKLIQGKSWPSDELLKQLCKYLDVNLPDAIRAVNADRAERQYGVKGASEVFGRNPRYADIDPYMPHLDDNEWRMFVAQIAGYVKERGRAEKREAR